MISPDRGLRIGTRRSDLARWQAEMVAQRLRARRAPEVEIVLIKTEGDRITDQPLHALPGKSFFTKEIEQALLEERIDIAVHSLKDLATELPAGLTIGAVLEREDPRDVLVCKGAASFENLAPGSRIGTSSRRRQALLKRWRPDLEIVDIRGNVPTRLKKVEDGAVDAVVLAAAGLLRLGLAGKIAEHLPMTRVLPAVSQGAIAVQIRENDSFTTDWVERLDDLETRWATTAERALLHRLEGGCQIPVGALAEVAGSQLTLSAVVCSLDGTQAIEGSRVGSVDEPETVGTRLAEDLLNRGAAEILGSIRTVGPSASPSTDSLAGPLTGQTVVVTRHESADLPLTTLFRRAGAEVLQWPVIEIVPPADTDPMETALGRIADYDWIVFTSGHAIDAVRRFKTDCPSTLRVAAVGSATARAVTSAGWPVHVQPVDFRAATLVEALAGQTMLEGAKILFPASSIARKTIPEELTRLGAMVDQVTAYETRSIPVDADRWHERLCSGEIYAVTFTSPSAVKAFCEAIGPDRCPEALDRAIVAAVGPTTAEALRHPYGIQSIVAETSTFDSLVTAVIHSLETKTGS